MPEFIDLIKHRLKDKELAPAEVRRLIRDVSNIIGSGECLSSPSLIHALESLGWKETLLDYRTLELICTFIETGGNADAFNHTEAPDPCLPGGAPQG